MKKSKIILLAFIWAMLVVLWVYVIYWFFV